jgi:hypothetical protein
MIVFDLCCANAHVFEIWFRSSDDYADQKARGLVSCPVCADTRIEKAVMPPYVSAKGNRAAAPASAKDKAIPPADARQLIAQIAEMQAEMLKESQWVGTAFADRARAMHLGDEPVRQIHGQASAEEATALLEEGVPVAPLPLPVIPPEARN